MYEALQRGTIDARALSYESSKRFKLYEVAKYMSDVNLGMVAGVNLLSINQDRWNSLSSANQKILLEEGNKAGEWEAQAMKDGNAVFKEFLEKKGMKMIKFSSKDREKWKGHPKIKAIADQWVASMEKKGLPGKRVLSIFLGK
jgi:TRAP-type C4-dicarboxylate transport system substrate-binding protein